MKQIASIFILVAALVTATTGCVSTTPQQTAAQQTLTQQAAALPDDLAERTIVPWEDLEIVPYWFAVGNTWKDNDSSLEAKQSTKNASEGRYSLECSFAMNGINGAAFCIEDLGKRSNWSDVDGILIDIYNATEKPVQGVIALCTGPDWVWQESGSVDLEAGGNFNVRFDFYDNTFKSAASGWKNIVSLKGAREVRRVVFKFFGVKGLTGAVYMDNIRFIKGAGAASLQEEPREVSTALKADETIGGRTKQYEGSLEIKDVSSNISGDSVPSYGKLEITFNVLAHISNPFDPDDMTISAEFMNPSKKKINVPAFYMIPYVDKGNSDRDRFEKSGEGVWKARFTPTEKGTWSYRIVAEQKGRKAAVGPFTFNVERKNARGFVRTRKGSRYFQFDSGEVYLPIGMNVGWYDGRGMAAYDEWFRRMSENGANYARVWMASWGFAIEWSDTGLGDYTVRQRQAAQLDRLFELADKYGIYIMLCLVNHGQFSGSTNTEWANNPYNVSRGGMLDRPVDFLTNERAKKLFRNRLRYIAARWGHNTSLFSWEWWNEVNLTDGLDNPKLLAPWMAEMKKHLSSVDPYAHLVSSSYSSPIRGNEDTWAAGGLDYVQVHAYDQQDWARYFIRTAADVLPAAKKPLLIGEFGINSSTIIDPDGIHFRDGLVSAVFGGCAGSAMLWWWDTYIEPKNLYRHFRGLSEFLRDDKELLPGTSPVAITDPSDYTSAFCAFALTGPKKTFVWVRNARYNYGDFIDLCLSVGLKNAKIPPVSNAVLDVPGLKAGTYTVEIWDPADARIISTREIMAEKSLAIALPEFTADLMIKIY